MRVPFFKQSLINQQFKNKFLTNIEDLFDASTPLVNGKYTKEFETSFSSYCGAKYFSFLSNGLDALILALRAICIQPGDEVIVPCHTYIATWLAPLQLGCKLVVVPVRSDNLLIDAENLENYMTERTKAVMPVHLYGNTCDIYKINELKKKFNFSIVEDAAQAHGSSIEKTGQKVGSLGDLTCFSFYPTKNLGALGEAGGISTDSSNLHEKIVSLRNYGRSRIDGALNDYCGYNSRGDELQALFLNEKLKSIESIADLRLKIVRRYSRRLSQLNDLFHLISYQSTSSPHLAILKTHSEKCRNDLRLFLAEKGIETAIHYKIPCHKQTFLLKSSLISIKQKDANHACNIANTILSLPCSEVHSLKEIDYICDSIIEFASD